MRNPGQYFQACQECLGCYVPMNYTKWKYWLVARWRPRPGTRLDVHVVIGNLLIFATLQPVLVITRTCVIIWQQLHPDRHEHAPSATAFTPTPSNVSMAHPSVCIMFLLGLLTDCWVGDPASLWCLQHCACVHMCMCACACVHVCMCSAVSTHLKQQRHERC